MEEFAKHLQKRLNAYWKVCHPDYTNIVERMTVTKDHRLKWMLCDRWTDDGKARGCLMSYGDVEALFRDLCSIDDGFQFPFPWRQGLIDTYNSLLPD